MKLRFALCLACLLAVISVSPVFAGPIGTYYLTTISGPWLNGDPLAFTGRPTGSTTFAIQGNQIVDQWVNSHPYEFGIAVAEDVRTAGYLWAGVGSLQGSQYTLGGDLISGTCCAAPFQQILDSTTDGEYNYLINFNEIHLKDGITRVVNGIEGKSFFLPSQPSRSSRDASTI